MAFADRTHIDRTSQPAVSRSGELTAGAAILLAAAIAALGLRQLVPTDAVAPIMVSVLFAGSAMAAGLALLSRRDRPRILWLDLAGGLTFIGIIISAFIEPDQLANLIGASHQPR
jgi:hypothetical protein